MAFQILPRTEESGLKPVKWQVIPISLLVLPSFFQQSCTR